jgi:hypothetical protein
MNFEDDFKMLMARDNLGDNEESAWGTLKERFALSPRHQRVEFIRRMNDYLTVPTPTREVADVWQKTRDLTALDECMERLGK